MRTLAALALLSLIAIGGRTAVAAGEPIPAAILDVLTHADEFEVVSLDPNVHRAFGYGPLAAESQPLARWLVALRETDGVFGRARVTDAAERREIVNALADGIAHPSPGAACYDPRHALVARRGNATVAVHLCFACDAVVLLEGSTIAGRTIGFGDTKGLQKRLDALLVAAKVPLAREVENSPVWKADPAALTRVVAARTRALFDDADAVEVLGVDSDVYAPFGSDRAGAIPLVSALASLAAGKGVKARAVLTRATARRAILGEVARGLVSPGQPAHCYNPRHALVLTKGDERAVVFLCFECSYAVCLDADTSTGKTQAFDDPGGLAARLDAILAAATAKPAPTGPLEPPAKPDPK